MVSDVKMFIECNYDCEFQILYSSLLANTKKMKIRMGYQA